MLVHSLTSIALLAVALVGASPQDASSSASNPAVPAPYTKKALELQPECMKNFVYRLDDRFKAKSKVAVPNCYTDPQDSEALSTLAQLLEKNPKQSQSIAKIMRSWTDNRAQCAIKQTAYAEAVKDVESFLGGTLPLKQASSGTFEGICAASNPFTTTCRTFAGQTTCVSGGGGLPSSQMVCRSGAYSSTCTFTKD